MGLREQGEDAASATTSPVLEHVKSDAPPRGPAEWNGMAGR
jgi:hypothetical protein